MSVVVVTQPAEFLRGAIVRRHGKGPNMLVVRYLGETTACVVNEGDDSGTLRFKEFPSRELWQVLETANP